MIHHATCRAARSTRRPRVLGPARRPAPSCVRAGEESCKPHFQDAPKKLKPNFQCYQQFSIVALTDGSGVIAKRYDYTAYGGPKIMSGTGTVLADSTKDNRYGYTGRECDETLGQCYFRARMYDAGAGRFLSRDRLKYMVAMGLFVFHDGRALSFLDPTVECSKRNIEHPEWHHQYPERLTFTSLSRSSKTHRPSRINTKSLVRRVVVTMIVGEAIKDFK